MTQDSVFFAKSARFGCTYGLVHANWHIPSDSGAHDFLKNRCSGGIQVPACSPNLQVHVGMLVIVID